MHFFIIPAMFAAVIWAIASERKKAKQLKQKKQETISDKCLIRSTTYPPCRLYPQGRTEVYHWGITVSELKSKL